MKEAQNKTVVAQNESYVEHNQCINIRNINFIQTTKITKLVKVRSEEHEATDTRTRTVAIKVQFGY